MEWTDIGIVLGTRRHGEANAILELMTREHGRHLGLVRGGAGSRLKPVLQAGNTVSATWRARLDEHLGHLVVEGIDLRAAALLPSAHAVYGVTHLAALWVQGCGAARPMVTRMRRGAVSAMRRRKVMAAECRTLACACRRFPLTVTTCGVSFETCTRP